MEKVIYEIYFCNDEKIIDIDKQFLQDSNDITQLFFPIFQHT